jgi:hypothetical protein
MKNVTVTLDEDVARWARVWAARQNKSVSRLLGEMLRERMRHEEGYERAMEEDLAVGGRGEAGSAFRSSRITTSA